MQEEVTEPNDAELLSRSIAGDMGAYDILVTRYRGRVYAMIFNMIRNDADAWDLTQETFIKAWRALKNFELRSSFYTWIYRIAHNVTYDSLRRKKIQGESEFDDTLAQMVEPGSMTAPRGNLPPDVAMDQSELGEKIRKALQQLSESHRAVLLYKEVQGMKYNEIATIMNCSEGTVMSRLFYARRKMQTILQEEYHEYR